MNGLWRQCALAAGLVLLGGGAARGEMLSLRDSPYQSFVDRNPFGLQPVPTNVVVQVTSPPPAKVNINLSGISYLAGKKRAWMVIPPGPGRTNTSYLSMTETDPEQEGVKVQSIDVERGLVQIMNAGVPATLDFHNHGVAYTGPVAVNVPAQTQPGRVVGRGARPGSPVSNPARPGMIQPGQVGANAPRGMTGTATPSVRTTIPARNVRTSQPIESQPIDPAIQAIQMRANELRARSQGIEYPPMPPIPGLPSGPGE